MHLGLTFLYETCLKLSCWVDLCDKRQSIFPFVSYVLDESSFKFYSAVAAINKCKYWKCSSEKIDVTNSCFKASLYCEPLKVKWIIKLDFFP